MQNKLIHKSFRLTHKNKYVILSKSFIKKTIKKVYKHTCIKYVILFGSYARNEAHALSDIDLLIGLDFNPKEYAEIYIKLEQIFNKRLDIYFVNHLMKDDDLKLKFLDSFIILYFKKGNIHRDLNKLES